MEAAPPSSACPWMLCGGGGSCTHATPQALKAAEPCATFLAALRDLENVPLGVESEAGWVGGGPLRLTPGNNQSAVCFPEVYGKGSFPHVVPLRSLGRIPPTPAYAVRPCSPEWGCHRGPRSWLRSGAGVNKAALSGPGSSLLLSTGQGGTVRSYGGGCDSRSRSCQTALQCAGAGPRSRQQPECPLHRILADPGLVCWPSASWREWGSWFHTCPCIRAMPSTFLQTWAICHP